jgi:hypothetical protein
MTRAFESWWTSTKTLGRGYALANIAIGLVCITLALADIRLGLGTYGRWLLGVPFGLVPLVWGVVALRVGTEPAAARALRIAGDVLLWVLTGVFTVLALLRDDPEFGPLITLVAIAAVTVVAALVNARRDRP